MRPAIRQILLSPWSPARLRSGSVGAWLDPSDLTYMTQDSAGTTGAALNQPVGKITDRFGFGAHGIQATAGSRPTLSALYNLATKTEQLDDAVWVKEQTTISPDQVAGPNGASSADKVVEDSATNIHRIYLSAVSGANGAYNFSIFAKAAGRHRVAMQLSDNLTGTVTIEANIQTGETTATGASGSWTGLVVDIEECGNGWFRLQVGGTRGAGTECVPIIYLADENGTTSYAGDGSKGIYLWGAQLEPSSTATRYQRVNTATDYDTAGFPVYIDFDTSDELVTTWASALGTNCTVGRAVPGVGASILTGQTIGTTYTDNTDHCGLVIIDRALSPQETLSLTRYLNKKAGV